MTVSLRLYAIAGMKPKWQKDLYELEFHPAISRTASSQRRK